MAVDWRLNALADPAGSFDQGYDRGRAMAGQRIIDNALSGDPAAAPDAIRRVDPALAASLQDRQRQEQERADRARIGGLATTNPLAARDEALRGGYSDLASALGQMDDQSRERAQKGVILLANVASGLGQQFQTPEQRRSAALHVVEWMANNGVLRPDQVAGLRASVTNLPWDDNSIADLQRAAAPFMAAPPNPLDAEEQRARIAEIKAREDERRAAAEWNRRRPAGGAGRGGRGGGSGGAPAGVPQGFVLD